MEVSFFWVSLNWLMFLQVPSMPATTPMSPEEEEELREAFAKIGKIAEVRGRHRAAHAAVLTSDL